MDEESDDDLDDNAILESNSIQHNGGINRLRTMCHSDTHLAATWSETGKVHIWNITANVTALDVPGTILPKDVKPIYTNTRHGRNEGYGLDWSSTVPGRLISGDTANKIYLTQAAGNTFSTEDQAFVGHTASVEDLQWSPTEQDVFVSASVDKTIRVWDIRAGKKPQLSITAHTADVNVLSWNRYV
jgi:ribosome assembly protein RRB1